MKMKMLFCSLLFVLGGDVLLACSLKNYTLYVERHECGHCMAVNTTMCSGMCFTQDTNVRGFVGKRFLIQRGCMHRSVVYHSAKMPGCPVHIDPLFFYPVARRCHCTKCNTTRNECVYKPKHTPSKCSEHLNVVPSENVFLLCLGNLQF
uniref:Thyroid stimulating hormone subunit beta n=1 Tax=Cyprinus carpio TaxID=7962 RepID=A0A8C2BVA1_CYPCA